ncbi:toxin-antitoxin system HicB family antitoxin [Amycolatopsis acidiphila]|uniref:Toxin-antitoxin system HicB family antitoxin n=1 Tax=Amycolatopsis acidiphila TaxID=715473 RepID=A0A557ZXA0_9PSEU|nr:toxin-antitoxin system HicB family antitoxin [Amycolatopsis acidiphila]TVT16628.1 toxin-antitoxin system HicB family antitoxin [Amycolatopsis acidiphila]UIJ58900.1 toxin-antitoxin system HicB family antitoxin [Amycolatopsis acidiphila]GHG72666.1 hypothetical protein GCM10017788_35350 [Amycolatopsis acidiphila]
MKQQLILRIDRELHARLKARAEVEGRSVNELAAEWLRAGVDQPEPPREWHRRLVAEGKLVTFEPDGAALGHDELERMSAGWGTSVSEALDWTRGEW